MIPESELIINKDGSVYHLSLRPEQISDVIITVGDPGRVHKVSKYFDHDGALEHEVVYREFITHTGYYKGRRLTVMSTGMGTDNIEIVLTELDALVNIDLKKREVKPDHTSLKIIRVGTSGALQESIELGTHLVSDYAIGLDTLMAFYQLPQSEEENTISQLVQERLSLPFRPYTVRGNEQLRDAIGQGMVAGNTVTCPGFYAPQGRVVRLPLRSNNLLRELTTLHHDNFWLTNFEMETAGYYAMARLLGHEVISVNAMVANRINNQFAKDAPKTIDSLIKKVLNNVVESL